MGWGVNDYPAPQEKRQPICPVCFEECYTLFFSSGEIVGCDNCIMEVNAYEWLEEREEYGE